MENSSIRSATDSQSGIGQLLNKLSTPVKYNPVSIINAVLTHQKNITQGKVNNVDPTNPFFTLLDSACVLATNCIVEDEILLRKIYPHLSQNEEELYSHMSDKDFIDRFASPSKTKISIFVSKSELDESFVFDSILNLYKLTIPRNTHINIAEYDFNLIYPVDIIKYNHGGYEVKYRFDEDSPVETLSSNQVNWEWRTMTGFSDKWLYLELDFFQFKIESFEDQINSISGFQKKYNFENQFYLARVFNKSNLTNNKWVELNTTHSDMVYDPNKNTAVLKLIDNTLTIKIPQIYISSGKISGSLRIDIYDTKGFLNLDLSNFDTSKYVADWKTINSDETTVYSAPLNSLNTLLLYSNSTVYGGKNALSFEELRQRVINHSVGAMNYPITNVQIPDYLKNEGYEIVKNVDVVTNRIFLATKNMAEPNSNDLITRANASIESFITSVDEFILADKTFDPVLGYGKFVKPNEDFSRLTVCPGLIFNLANSIISIFSTDNIKSFRDLNTEVNFLDKLKLSSENRFLYCPFHYVLDYNQNEFEIRPYQLDNPKVSSILVSSQLETVNSQAIIAATSLEYKDDHYLFRFKTESNDFYKNISQSRKSFKLSFIPDDDINETFILVRDSVIDNNENLVEFKLNTKLDIDSKNYLYFSNFSFSRNTKSSLNQKFKLEFLLDDVVISEQTVGLEFGKHLKNLWARSRNVVSYDLYEKHTIDLPARYKEDIYELDPVTKSKYRFDSNGKLMQPNIIHQRGEYIYIDNELQYEYRAGDIVLDNNGQPKLLKPTVVNRLIDLFFIDGVYFLADDSVAKNYRKLVINTLVDQITVELNSLNDKLLEQTSIYFYPKCSLGDIKVLADKNKQLFIPAEQSFIVNLYVSDNIFNSIQNQNEIKKKTIRVIDKILTNKTISVSEIIYELKKIYPTTVLEIDVKGLGNEHNLRTITLLNNEDNLSIKKKITKLQNNSSIVEEDIVVNFFKHSKDSI